MVKKFREPAKTERNIRYVIAKPNAPPENIEFDTSGLLVKVEEVSPRSSVVSSRIFIITINISSSPS